MEAIFIQFFNSNFQEFKLYKALREFVLLAFSSTFVETDLRKLDFLANQVINFCVSIQPDFSIYCKLHHLLHYGDLIKFFGPLYLYSTFR